MSGMVTASLLPERKPRRHEEELLQRSVVQFLRVALPADAKCFAIPNGGKRHTKAAARLVGMGVYAGTPDLEVIWRGHALFIELKTPTGSLSAVQRQAIDKLRLCGATVLVCRSVDCVETGLREFGVPLTASATGWRPHSRAYDAAQDAFSEWGGRHDHA